MYSLYSAKFRVKFLLALDTPTYKLTKFLVPIFKPLTTNDFTVKDSFHFAEEIVDQQHDLFMGSWDVDSLFTNIPLEVTIEICTNELFKESEAVEGLSKTEFKELLSLATKDSHFIFGETHYKEIDGVAMGSPLGPTLANAFLIYHEKNWLEYCTLESLEYCPLDHYTIEGTLMIYLYYLIHQNILNVFIVT